MRIHLLLAERRVRRALEFAGDERELLGQDIIVRALRELRGHPGAAAELIEVARAGDVLEVERVGAIGLAGRGLLAVAPAVGGLEAVTALHLLELALRVRRVGVTIDRIRREAVRGPADVHHLLLAGREPLDEQGGEAVVVVGAVGLDVPVVIVEAQAGRDAGGGAHGGVAPQGFVMPGVGAVAVVVDLGGTRVEDHPVQGHAPGGHHPAGRPAGGGFGLGRHLEVVLLLGDGVGVPPVRELRDLMVRDAVGLDDPLVALDGDRDLVLGGRVGVGGLQGRALGGVGGAQAGGQAQADQGEEAGTHGNNIIMDTPLSQG